MKRHDDNNELPQQRERSQIITLFSMTGMQTAIANDCTVQGKMMGEYAYGRTLCDGVTKNNLTVDGDAVEQMFQVSVTFL